MVTVTVFTESMDMPAYCISCIFRYCSYVVRDKEQDVLYDILMTKVDVRIGEWGLYNFYKMQVCLFISCVER